MPNASTVPATRKAPLNEPEAATMAPVTIGEITPIVAFTQFMMLPTVPVPPRGAISAGIAQPAGAAVASPQSEIVTHTSAQPVLLVNAVPNTAVPVIMPAIR